MKYYFDTETIGLNPYSVDAKMVTAQITDDNGNEIVLKEWELGEMELLMELKKIFNNINFKSDKSEFYIKTYNPVFTYNGAFDFNYIMGRVNMLFDSLIISDYHDILIRGTKHCDILQYDNGYFVSLAKLANEYDIKFECEYNGSHIQALYNDKKYDFIVAHALDDIRVVKCLVNKHGFGDRFINVSVLDKTRWLRK